MHSSRVVIRSQVRSCTTLQSFRARSRHTGSQSYPDLLKKNKRVCCWRTGRLLAVPRAVAKHSHAGWYYRENRVDQVCRAGSQWAGMCSLTTRTCQTRKQLKTLFPECAVSWAGMIPCSLLAGMVTAISRETLTFDTQALPLSRPASSLLSSCRLRHVTRRQFDWRSSCEANPWRHDTISVDSGHTGVALRAKG